MFIKNSKGEWLELDEASMMLYNFYGGWHPTTQDQINSSETLECAGWRQLYLIKGYCPLSVDMNWNYVWISPEGNYYNGDAHENRAKDILEIVYREDDIDWPGDRLEELGWIRASATLMWDMRLLSHYFDDKRLTQKQFDALYDWCKYHKKWFPKGICTA